MSNMRQRSVLFYPLKPLGLFFLFSEFSSKICICVKLSKTKDEHRKMLLLHCMKNIGSYMPTQHAHVSFKQSMFHFVPDIKTRLSFGFP